MCSGNWRENNEDAAAYSKTNLLQQAGGRRGVGSEGGNTILESAM